MFTESNVHWIKIESTSGVLVERAIDSFENLTGLTLHPVAKTHLLNGSTYPDDPFPRMETHDRYLFAQLSFPSSMKDSNANFDELVLVATHDQVLVTVTAHSSSEINWSQLRDETTMKSQQSQNGCVAGNFLQILFRVVIDKLHTDATYLDNMIQEIADNLLIGDDLEDVNQENFEAPSLTRGQQKNLQSAAQQARPLVSAIRHELPSIKRVISETENILERIATDVIDLPIDTAGNLRELFTRDIEIYMFDINVNARHVESMVEAIESKLLSTIERLRQIDSAEQVRANRFTGAIASVMLFPTFVVGLYGQNFDNLPEIDWRYGYLMSWGIIVGATALQVWFFRRRRWL